MASNDRITLFFIAFENWFCRICCEFVEPPEFDGLSNTTIPFLANPFIGGGGGGGGGIVFISPKPEFWYINRLWDRLFCCLMNPCCWVWAAAAACCFLTINRFRCSSCWWRNLATSWDHVEVWRDGFGETCQLIQELSAIK